MMGPISALPSGAVYAPAPVRDAPSPQAQRPEEDARAPRMDEYVPEEERERSGLYYPGRDRDGSPKIFFDDPERAPEDRSPEDRAPGGPEAPEGRRAERCTCDTGRVDREIERLRKRQETLEKQLRRETDAARIQELERKLSQVERELRRKDNDSYRRQHADFS